MKGMKRVDRKWLIVIGTAIAFGTMLNPGKAADIRGNIIPPCRSVRIIATNNSSGKDYESRSSDEGDSFSITELPKGKYDISVICPLEFADLRGRTPWESAGVPVDKWISAYAEPNLPALSKFYADEVVINGSTVKRDKLLNNLRIYYARLEGILYGVKVITSRRLSAYVVELEVIDALTAKHKQIGVPYTDFGASLYRWKKDVKGWRITDKKSLLSESLIKESYANSGKPTLILKSLSDIAIPNSLVETEIDVQLTETSKQVEKDRDEIEENIHGLKVLMSGKEKVKLSDVFSQDYVGTYGVNIGMLKKTLGRSPLDLQLPVSSIILSGEHAMVDMSAGLPQGTGSQRLRTLLDRTPLGWRIASIDLPEDVFNE